VAAELDEGVRADLVRIRDDLRRLGGDVKWVNGENLHLTFQFLGDLDPDRIEVVGDALAEAVAGVDPFDFRVAGVGSFPPRRPPRVVWVGITDGVERLRDLYERLATGLRRIGFEPEDRPYHPHITLGRVRSAGGIGPLRARIDRGTGAPDRVQRLEEIVLKRSDLSPQGPTYSDLRRIRLGGPS